MLTIRIELPWQLICDPGERDVGLGTAKLLQYVRVRPVLGKKGLATRRKAFAGREVVAATRAVGRETWVRPATEPALQRVATSESLFPSEEGARYVSVWNSDPVVEVVGFQLEFPMAASLRATAKTCNG